MHTPPPLQHPPKNEQMTSHLFKSASGNNTCTFYDLLLEITVNGLGERRKIPVSANQTLTQSLTCGTWWARLSAHKWWQWELTSTTNWKLHTELCPWINPSPAIPSVMIAPERQGLFPCISSHSSRNKVWRLAVWEIITDAYKRHDELMLNVLRCHLTY